MGCLDALRVILAVINILGNGVYFLCGLILAVQGLLGLLLVNLGFNLLLDAEQLSFYNLVLCIYMTIGVLLIVFSVSAIIGSIVACFPNSPGLKCFAATLLVADLIALILVFVLGVAGVAYVFIYRDIVADSLVGYLNTAVNESYSIDFNNTHDSLAVIQTYFSCCGINGPQDFNTYPNVDTLPPGCCALPTTNCTTTTATITIGCGTKFRALVIEYYSWIGGIGIAEVVVISLFILLESVLILLVVSKKADTYKGCT